MFDYYLVCFHYSKERKNTKYFGFKTAFWALLYKQNTLCLDAGKFQS